MGPPSYLTASIRVRRRRKRARVRAASIDSEHNRGAERRHLEGKGQALAPEVGPGGLMSGFRGHRRDGGDPLALDAVTMRELGYRTVDMLVAQLAAVADGPALRRASPEEMAMRVPDGPQGPREFDALLGVLEEHVLPYTSRCDHPRYFAFIPACGTFPAALGDFIASALNIYTGSWMESAGPRRLELMVLEPFKQWIGYPPGVAGILVSGGSAANMTALACVREAAGEDGDEGVGYVSDQAHSSIARAARALGLRVDQVRVLPTDPGGTGCASTR